MFRRRQGAARRRRVSHRGQRFSRRLQRRDAQFPFRIGPARARRKKLVRFFLRAATFSRSITSLVARFSASCEFHRVAHTFTHTTVLLSEDSTCQKLNNPPPPRPTIGLRATKIWFACSGIGPRPSAKDCPAATGCAPIRITSISSTQGIPAPRFG